MINFPQPQTIPEFIVLVLIVGAAIWGIFGNHEKQEQVIFYRPGDLFIKPNTGLDGGYIVYSLPDNYANLYEGTLEECQEWIQQNTNFDVIDE